MSHESRRSHDEPLVLLVVADEQSRKELEGFLTLQGVRALAVPSGLHAQQILEHDRVGVLLAEKELSGIDGLDFLILVQERWGWVRRVLMAERPRGETVMRAYVRASARVLVKPVLPSVLLRTVREELLAYAAENTRP